MLGLGSRRLERGEKERCGLVMIMMKIGVGVVGCGDGLTSVVVRFGLVVAIYGDGVCR